ncbi:discoidin domain-containing protein [Roseofilum sp. Guam]|uniref:discoidin domain-containing protein n=1 Tax=Roseofilum sp. Guam TaxID=2821502 RepID=UPI001B1C2B02|nr:discoidin domain-containing protein [Roseofilum sp. Guam]MBP0031203.1 discoidin domain-containing protein [Roseofilum sp. Guam]
MGIINTGTGKNINLGGDRITLTLTGTDGSSTSLVVEGTQEQITGGGNGGGSSNGEGTTLEPITVESAGKGLRFLPPFPTQPVLLGIDKQDSFYPLWQGSPIQVFQWSQEPNPERIGATWMGEFNPSDKRFILLLPTAEAPWFSFLTKSAQTGVWDIARVELKEGRKLYFWDFEETTEAWQYEENVTPTPVATPTPTPDPSPTPAPTPTPVTGWMPTSGWQIEAQAHHYQTATLATTGSLSAVNDGNEATYWVSPVLSQHNIALTIDLGQLVEIEKISISSGDVPHRAKGTIQTSDDGITFTSTGFSNFLNGEIAINQTKRFILIQCGQNINAAYDEWHLKEIFLYGTYDSNLVGGSPSPTPSPTPSPVPVPPPTPIEPSAYLDSNNIILKTDSLSPGGLTKWDGFIATGAVPTVIVDGANKFVSFPDTDTSQMERNIAQTKQIYGMTCVVKSPTELWNNWGNVFSHNLGGLWSFAFAANTKAVYNNPVLERVRINKQEKVLSGSNWQAADSINSPFCLSIIFPSSNRQHTPGNMIIHQSDAFPAWRCAMDIGDILVWGNMPSDAELVEVEDWMMGKYSI